MRPGATRVSARWLALREGADADARSRDLADRLERELPPDGRRTIHDLGSGTGAMGRWLAPLLSGEQHWVAHDRDPDLLELAANDRPGPAADGSPVTVEARHTDITGLRAPDLAGATLITASAILDLLTAHELDRLAATCLEVGCPILLTLSVNGAVEIAPGSALDGPVTAAFNAHQCRMTERGRLLGPDAPRFAAEALRGLGAEVLLRPSPWLLGPGQSDLAAEWFTGWVGAAREQQPELGARCERYAGRRLEQAHAGELTVTVGHTDLLALP